MKGLVKAVLFTIVMLLIIAAILGNATQNIEEAKEKGIEIKEGGVTRGGIKLGWSFGVWFWAGVFTVYLIAKWKHED